VKNRAENVIAIAAVPEDLGKSSKEHTEDDEIKNSKLKGGEMNFNIR
jgi:hypothetical protein